LRAFGRFLRAFHWQVDRIFGGSPECGIFVEYQLTGLEAGKISHSFDYNQSASDTMSGGSTDYSDAHIGGSMKMRCCMSQERMTAN
jgi:hypothetical protein